MERTEGPAPFRDDLAAARSRLRAAYGMQREIARLADLLEPGEVLLQLAITNGPARADRRQHGLLALSDVRLIFVPKSSAQAAVDQTELGQIRALTWSANDHGGTLGLIGDDFTRSYAGLSHADGRGLILAVRAVRPGIRYGEAPV